jgi:hypothetical protein
MFSVNSLNVKEKTTAMKEMRLTDGLSSVKSMFELFPSLFISFYYIPFMYFLPFHFLLSVHKQIAHVGTESSLSLFNKWLRIGRHVFDSSKRQKCSLRYNCQTNSEVYLTSILKGPLISTSTRAFPSVFLIGMLCM